jgi:hypothetical protein
MADRPTVLYVGGVIRSGSTLLHRILGELPGYVPIGEFVHLWRYCLPLDTDCGCGEPFSKCPFWTRVGDVAFGGWDRIDHEEMLGLARRLDVTKAIPALVVPHPGKTRSRDRDRYAGVLSTIYRSIAEVSGAQVIVDSSKYPGAAYLLRRVPAVDLRVITIVRDPRGVAYSCSKRVRRPEKVSPDEYMTVWTTRQITRNWVTTTLLVSAISRFGVTATTVRYEDLMTDPVAEIDRVGDVLGLPVTGVEQFLTSDSVRLSPAHTLDGNPMRFATGPIPIRADEEWRTSLPARDRRLVETLSWPWRRRYGYVAGDRAS